MGMVYKWKDAAIGVLHLDAQTVGEHLHALRQERGDLTAETVVEDARRDESPTHDAFEWDDSVAAHQHRLAQARGVLRFIVEIEVRDAADAPRPIDFVTGRLSPPVRGSATAVAEPDDPPATERRAFTFVTGGGHRRYEPTMVAMSDPDLRREVLLRVAREAQILIDRNRHIEELAEVVIAVERFVASLAPEGLPSLPDDAA